MSNEPPTRPINEPPTASPPRPGATATSGTPIHPDGETSKLPPTRPLSIAGVVGNPPPAAAASKAEHSMSLSAALVDSRDTREAILARLIVERGLATQEEVDRCQAKRGKAGLFGGRRDFRKILLDERAVTPNQLARIEELVEQQRGGKSIPGFKMLGKLGKGTTATVYKARQINLDRLVAIKVLPSGSIRSAKAVEQFYAEGRAAAKLNHQNIVQAFDVGQAGEVHYFVMEYVEGLTVHEMLTERGVIDQQTSLDIVIAMADALKHAHEKGLVHRDVKPKNIILDAKGTAKLADLGLARFIADREAGLAEKGHALGTPYYISPEQVRGEVEIGPPADVYSLGATFYHMVTGTPPFTGVDAREVMNKHLHIVARPAVEAAPGLNPGLSEVIDKMLAKKAQDRYHDCDMLLLDLMAWRAVFTLAKGEEETGRGGQ